MNAEQQEKQHRLGISTEQNVNSRVIMRRAVPFDAFGP